MFFTFPFPKLRFCFDFFTEGGLSPDGCLPRSNRAFPSFSCFRGPFFFPAALPLFLIGAVPYVVIFFLVRTWVVTRFFLNVVLGPRSSSGNMVFQLIAPSKRNFWWFEVLLPFPSRYRRRRPPLDFSILYILSGSDCLRFNPGHFAKIIR